MLAALSGGRQIIAEFPVQLLRWSNAGRPACGESRRAPGEMRSFTQRVAREVKGTHC